jgi:SAM-dependent methyltransferase
VGVGRVDTSELDDFVARCDALGGIASPDAVEFVADFSLSFSTAVNTTLDPFSDEYFAAQVQLHKELSGRALDQDNNELHDVDVAGLASTANPYGSVDADHIAKHARTILNSIIVSDLPPGASVLDMGCGWGVSTEMFGYCGCRVTAVDINPLFVDLVAQRSAARGYDVRTAQTTFDTFETEDDFDLVFFYECLHHATRPWETLARLGRHVKPGGKITIAGEPIQDEWWPHWGLRLDPQSVYCMHKFGWFESGWSADFLTDCFRRAGFELTLLDGIGIQHSAIGVAVRPGETAEPPTAHWLVPQRAPEPEGFERLIDLARRAASKVAGTRGGS